MDQPPPAYNNQPQPPQIPVSSDEKITGQQQQEMPVSEVHASQQTAMPMSQPNMPPVPMVYGPQVQYAPFPGATIPTISADLAGSSKPAMVTCPQCNTTGMTIVKVKANTLLLVIALICFVTLYPMLMGFIVLIFTFYRAHFCSRCNSEITRCQICC